MSTDLDSFHPAAASPVPGTLAALKQAAAIRGLRGVVAMSPENFGFLSGLHVPTLQLIRGRQSILFVPVEGEPQLILCSIERMLAESSEWRGQARYYTEFVDQPMAILAALLVESGLAGAAIGVDGDYLPLADSRRLQAVLPDIALVDTTDLVTSLRMAKTQEEIGRLRHATQATHRAAIEAMAAARPGDSERVLCARLVSQLFLEGADTLIFIVLASGERGREIHPTPSDAVPEPGEIIRFDFGGRFGAMPSDLARTYSAGDPTLEQRQVYAALRRVQAHTIAAVEPGISAADLFHICRDAFREEGVDYRLPHIGHNMGHEFHEPPLLRPGDRTPLRPGMTINVEPIAFDSSGTVYHLEDLVEVTEDGHRLLSLGLAPPELPVIGQAIRYD
jgi:Xaa-Pro dipeptidase